VEINLLPRPTFTEKYGRLLVVIPVVVVLAISLEGYLYYQNLSTRVANTQAEVDRVHSDITVLMAERAITPQTRRLLDLQQTVHDKRGEQHDTAQMLDGIAAKLSEKSKVTSAAMDADKGAVVLDISSESIDVIAEYEELLRAEPWVSDVLVEKIENESAKDQSKNSDKTAANPSSNPPDTNSGSADSKGLNDQKIVELEHKERPYKAQFTILLKPNEIPVEKKTDDKSKK
jgi:hypothetical protein